MSTAARARRESGVGGRVRSRVAASEKRSRRMSVKAPETSKDGDGDETGDVDGDEAGAENETGDGDGAGAENETGDGDGDGAENETGDETSGAWWIIAPWVETSFRSCCIPRSVS